MKDELIRRADIMAGLTSSEMQKKLKQGTGEEAYNAFLEMVNLSPAADVVEVIRDHLRDLTKMVEEDNNG